MPNSEDGDPKKTDGLVVEYDSILAAVFAAMAEGVVVQDQTGAILASNSSAERILGLTADQITGRTSLDPRWRAVHEDGSAFPGETHPAMVTLRTGEACSKIVMGIHRPDGTLVWILINSRLLGGQDEKRPRAVVVTFAEITELRQLHEEREALAAELHRTLTKVLSGYLPICASCKSIRDTKSNWIVLEQYIKSRTGADFTHTVCPTCAAELYPDLTLGGE